MGEALALATALCYGLTHFWSGILARRASGIGVAFYTQAGGSVVFILLATVFPGGDVTMAALGWGALSGVTAGLAMAFLYRGMSRAKMSVVVPLSDVNAALLPVILGIALLGERPSTLALLGIVTALPAIWLVSRGEESRTGGTVDSGVFDGLCAGAGIALTWVALSRIPADSGLWPFVLSRLCSVAAIVPLVIATRTQLRMPSGIVLPASIAGTIGGFGTMFVMFATREQLLAVVTVLSALYPAIPVLLALIILRERITAAQTAGLGIGAVAISMIALNS